MERMTEKTAAESRTNESVFQFSNRNLFRSLCGISDSGVDDLAKLLGVLLIPRGHSFLIRSDNPELDGLANAFFEALSRSYPPDRNILPDRFDIEYMYRHLKKKFEEDAAPAADLEELLKTKIFMTSRGKSVFPRTYNQAHYVKSIKENSITFCLGPAGTGKTFLSIVSACRMLTQGDVERIILTRPAVEAGESLGFLPGDLTQKVDPYLRPVYDALYECMGMEKVHELIGARRIEIAPLAYMRGRTLSDSMIILDEAQNCTLGQLKMFLTRLGKNSRMCIGGDVTQIDLLPGKSGLKKTISILRQVEGVGVIEFGREDIVRNPLVEKIVLAFEQMFEERSD